MGYRSEAMLAITKAEDIILRTTVPAVIEVLDCANEIRQKRFPHNGEEYVTYTWDHIKWYDSWPAVEALERWMTNRPDEEGAEDMNFQFIRDGEDARDVDEYGNYNFGLEMRLLHEDDIIDTRIRKALTNCLAMIEGEWGQYMDEDFKKSFDLLVPLSNLRQSQENSDKL